MTLYTNDIDSYSEILDTRLLSINLNPNPATPRQICWPCRVKSGLDVWPGVVDANDKAVDVI